MDAYIFKSDLYCPQCIAEIKANILAFGGFTPPNPNDETSYDSDTYPKGPYSDGGGESDSPAHCGTCHVFLENPLTQAGEDYVREQIAARKKTDVVEEWKAFYSYLSD